MIKLEVADYCQNCPMFEPDVVNRPKMKTLTGYDIMSGQTVRSAVYQGDTIVVCKNHNRCDIIYHNILENQKDMTNGLVKGDRQSND